MKTSKVRCWEIRKGVYITYPEGNLGHELITCLSCGTVYAVDVSRKVYVGPPLEERLKDLACLKCGCNLGTSWAFYPEKHLTDTGRIEVLQRPMQLPPDDQSIVAEFPEIYSD